MSDLIERIRVAGFDGAVMGTDCGLFIPASWAIDKIEAQQAEITRLREALRLAHMAGDNLLAELDASDAEFEPEDRAVIEGAREDLTTARKALELKP